MAVARRPVTFSRSGGSGTAQPIAVRELHDDVRRAVDPQDRGRQYIASQLERLAGTRLAGFVFTRQPPAGKWGAATYALKKTESSPGA